VLCQKLNLQQLLKKGKRENLMYKISKWKLILIILVFIFTGLYLLPSIPSLYGNIYGYLDLWMQGKIPRPYVQSGMDGDYINFIIPGANLPKGMNSQEASKTVKDAINRRLVKLGYKDSYKFESPTEEQIKLTFNDKKSRAELEKILGDMKLYGIIPLSIRPIFPDKPIKQGLDLKGGMHVVLELDMKKATDAYLGGQAKDIIMGNLKRDKIFAKSINKTVEKVGDATIIVRPYVEADSQVDAAQRMLEVKQKLIDLGFGETQIQDTSKEGAEFTITLLHERDISDIVDSIFGGINPLIVTVTIPERFQGVDREEYIDTTQKSLGKLDYFGKPKKMALLRPKDNTIAYSVQLSTESADRLAKDNIDTVMKTLENRINKFGVAESTIRRVSGRPRILIEIPEEQNPTQTLAAIKTPGVLQFKLVKTNSSGGPWQGQAGSPEPQPSQLPPGSELRRDADNNWYVLDSEIFMQGSDLKSNSAQVTRGEFGSPEVIMYLTSEGQRKFTEFTGSHVEELTAIMLDDVIQSAPRINEKISSPSARISGSFTDDEANYLAKILRAGAFPAPMKTAEERIVGPTLGAESIRRGQLAFALGLSLVVIFMLVYYRWSGAIAVTALIFQVEIILGILAGFGATLTLPGIAGLILTIGMSVDANVLVFERIKEELRTGKTVRSAIDTGYHKALSAILDSNVTTIIAGLILYEFGTGPIKGFAVTLIIGLLANIFSAVFVTREIYNWTYYRKRRLETLSI
jgi:preprotein translocase subunit SecD